MIAYRTVQCLTALTLWAGAALAQEPAAPAPAERTAEARWLPVAVQRGRLMPAQLGLVINTADPYSVAVGEYYAERRGLSPEQVLRVELPLRPTLTAEEFETLREAVATRFDGRIQALALAWTQPYAVQCLSITGALALGLDSALCQRTCAPSRPSPLFNSPSLQPYGDFGLRPSMLLAAPGIDAAKAMIDRGVAANGSLRQTDRPPARVALLVTNDRARNVRAAVYPPPGRVDVAGLDVRVIEPPALKDLDRLLLVQTGSVRLDLPSALDWLPGALADHLTSAGGQLLGQQAQSTALEWIASGATASHGTVSEPCNHLQKFPHPQVLLQIYAQGATAIEAYWKSVAWPSQGLFIGEPLAAPFGR